MSNATVATMNMASGKQSTLAKWMPMILMAGLALLAVVLGMSGAHASTAGESSALPWDSTLKVLADSISGPVAKLISLIGIAVTGMMLIFGGEISEFARRMVFVVLVVSIIMFASSLLTGSLFSGATIPDVTNFIGGAASQVTAVVPAA